MADEQRPLIGIVDTVGGPVNLEAYESHDGYAAARQALATDPNDIIDLVSEANLRGRGGAGFGTGMKWDFTRGPAKTPGGKYLVCNADEMEPGTFKDRYLLEYNPHLLIEGIIIAAHAIHAETAYVFLRGEYHDPYRELQRAIDDAYAKGYLGKRVFGTDINLELRIHRSAGRYICGEETALLNALEGKRAQPRQKPPFPPASGAWGRPTIVNNVETLCNVPAIVRNGAEWYQDLGIGDDSGTKIYGVSGRVNNPGLWELPIGTTIREIIEEHAGGMRTGYKLRGLLPGGASTDFLVEEHLDLAMDYGTNVAAGSRMGTGTMILMDDSICPVDMCSNLEHFFAQES
ncbi:MAG: SLBB domain-containing protein, partial [Gammaproteobacteria bacterium]|nr:SLBB domain-containing protein [Gammaproteobacteria bacterium]